jgi:hypothetical protein
VHPSSTGCFMASNNPGEKATLDKHQLRIITHFFCANSQKQQTHHYHESRPPDNTWWLNSRLGRVGLRFELQLYFFLPTTRHQEIQGVGYAHNTCGRRPWVQTLLMVLVHLATSINLQLDSQLVRVKPLAPQAGRQGQQVLGPYLKKFVHEV